MRVASYCCFRKKFCTLFHPSAPSFSTVGHWKNRKYLEEVSCASQARVFPGAEDMTKHCNLFRCRSVISFLPASRRKYSLPQVAVPSSHLERVRCSSPWVGRHQRPLPVVCHLLANSGKMGFGNLRTVSISFSPGGILVLTQLRQTPSVGISPPLGREHG